jgi:hypothetical protein
MSGQASAKGWYVGRWPPLAWLVGAIKGVAIAIGTAANVRARAVGVLWRPEMLGVWHPEPVVLAQGIILAILSLGLVIALLDRLRRREVVAIIFLILNNFGHWGMVLALAFKPGPGWRLPALAGLMLVSDLVKLLSLQIHRFAVPGISREVLNRSTAAYAAGYSLILVLELVR